jgi:hypothetical protein
MLLKGTETLGSEDRSLVEGSYYAYRAEGFSDRDAGLKALADFHKAILADMNGLRAVVKLQPIPSRHIFEKRVASKTFEYDGLTLGREPTALEKTLDLKGMVASLETSKERVNRVLVGIRDDLITQAVSDLKDHTADTIYQLVLTPPLQASKKLRKEIEAAVNIGRAQVDNELSRGKAHSPASLDTKDKGTVADYISRLVDLLISRTVKEIQTRAVDLFASLGILGLSDEEIVSRLKEQLDEQSVKVFESFASQAANASINYGRDTEADERKDDWVTVEYSALLDKNTCPECEDADGQQAKDAADLPDAPNPDCEGGPLCRCFHIYIGNEENA